jgi:GNAT superfamily N-acetyltransferase
MSLKIREATEDDLPAVLALYAQPSMDNGPVLTLAEASGLLAQFRHYPSYRLWVACRDQTDSGKDNTSNSNSDSHTSPSTLAVVGTYALLIMHNLAHRGTPSAIVEDVVVREDLQGRGIGQQMMQHAQSQARAAGCYKLVLSSNQKRESAHAFYASLGFQRHGFSFVIGI